MNHRAMALAALFSLVLIGQAGCFPGMLAYFNDPLPAEQAAEELSPAQAAARAVRDGRLRATRTIVDVRGHRKTTVFLALSGGGSRAAYFSACCMFKLGPLLKQVDVISCVSGGSWAGAYYCISEDPADTAKRRADATTTESVLRFLQLQQIPYHRWDEPSVKAHLGKSLDWRFALKWLHPGDTLRSWLTAWDRSDTMSEVLAEELFYIQPLPFRTIHTVVPTLLRQGYAMGELNPERPYLIINATRAARGEAFGERFSFTREGFASLGSDIRTYPLSRAVMAASAFPAAMNHMTLRDYHKEATAPRGYRRRQYLHLIDGGVCDNLGLGAVDKAMTDMEEALHAQGRTDQKYVIVLIDAGTNSGGASGEDPDPRKRLLGTPADANVLSAFDILLKTNSERTLRVLKNHLNQPSLRRRTRFLHLTFRDIPPGAVHLDSDGRPVQPGDEVKESEKTRDLAKAVNRVPTAFRMSDYNANVIEAATDELFRLNKAKLDMLYKWATGE